MSSNSPIKNMSDFTPSTFQWIRKRKIQTHPGMNSYSFAVPLMNRWATYRLQKKDQNNKIIQHLKRGTRTKGNHWAPLRKQVTKSLFFTGVQERSKSFPLEP